jgi:hypothetical protein
MPKADFDTYVLPGLDAEFVRPAIDNDPYKGQYQLESVGGMAIARMLNAGENVINDDFTVTVELIPEANLHNYFYRNLRKECEYVVAQRVRAEIQLPYEEGGSFYSHIFNELSRVMLLGSGHTVEPMRPSDDPHAQVIKLRQESTGAFVDSALYDFDTDEPKNPVMLFGQGLILRAHQWLPGPVRRNRATGRFMKPTHSPRPAAIALLQTVEVIGISGITEPFDPSRQIGGHTAAKGV